MRNDSSSFENKFFYGLNATDNLTSSMRKREGNFVVATIRSKKNTHQFHCTFEIAFEDAPERHLTQTHE